MTNSGTTDRVAEVSPQLKARMAGVFQLCESLTATFGQVFVLGRLVVSGNAAMTAANILGHERIYWLGFAASLMAVAFHIAWGLLMYQLLKPVSRSVAIIAASVIVVASSAQALAGLLYIAPLLILQTGNSATAFTTEQLQSLALLFLKFNSYAFAIHTMFFGLWCVLTGYLIFKSTFLPRVLGVLLMVSGLGWLVYLYPPFAYSVFPFIAGASAIGEIPIEFWLIIKGVNVARWKQCQL